MLDLDVTSPLRNLEDLKTAFGMLAGDAEAVNLFSVSPAGRSPYFQYGRAERERLLCSGEATRYEVFTRQSAPVVYDLNASFYFYRRLFLTWGIKGQLQISHWFM